LLRALGRVHLDDRLECRLDLRPASRFHSTAQ
jgi:hypothetical protein